MLTLLIFSPLSLENGRGGELSTIELASGLKKYYNIILVDTNIIMEDSNLSKKDIQEKIPEIQRILKLYFACLNVLNRNFSIPYPWEIIKFYRLIKKADIVYTSISFFKIDVLFFLFSLIFPKKIFIIGYRKQLYSEKIFSLYNLRYRLSILFLSINNRNIYHHTLSIQAKKYLEHFYKADKIVHITHGIELKDYLINRKEIEQSKKLRFIYVGALEDVHKGFGTLLEAIKRILEENKELKITFEFCGTGPLKNKLIELEKHFPQYIKYYGYVQNQKLPEIYQENDIFLFSSRDEPFGRVIIEALASGLIIICTITIGSVEILKGQKFAYFIKEFNPNAFKNEILDIYNKWKNDADVFKQLRKDAEQYAVQYYSFSKELQTFKELIERLYKKRE